MNGVDPARIEAPKSLGERIWPHVMALWIAGVFVAFLIVRVAGSNLADAVLHRLGLR